MKKTIILGILGLAAATVSSYGQGAVFLDNYQSSLYNPVVFSAPLGGGLVGTGYTVGLYVSAAGANLTGSLAADPTGFADPSTLGALSLASGNGATAAVDVAPTGPGYFEASASYLIQAGSATPAQSSYTIMLVAYNGASYAASTIRGHSSALFIQDASPAVAFGADLGGFWAAGPTPIITVFQTVPEPTTMALGGLGLAALLIARRKKA